MEREIRSSNAALSNAVGRRDSIGISALYTPDARLLTPGGELLAGRFEIEAYWRAGLALGVSRVEFVSLALQLHDATAVEVGRYAISVRVARGSAAVQRGMYLVAYGQAGGSWQRSLETFSAASLLGRST